MTDNLWLSFIADEPGRSILYCSSPDGNNWGSDYQLIPFWAFDNATQSSPLAPSLAFFNNQIFVAFISATPGDPQVLLCSTPYPGDWGQWDNTFLQNQALGPSAGWTALDQYSPFAPSLAVFNNRLYAAFIANDPSNNVLVCSTGDGVNWTGSTKIGQLSATAPSLAAFNGQLYCAFVADNGTGNVLICSSSDGGNWTGNTNTGQSSSLAPSLAVAPFPAGEPLTESEAAGGIFPSPPLPGWPK